MKLNPNEKYGVVVSLISANVFLMLTKATFFGLLGMGISLNTRFVIQAIVCYTFLGITISSLYTPIHIFWTVRRRGVVENG